MTGVLIDRVLSDDAFDTVSADSAAASAELASQLIGKGHRHILVVGLGEQAATVRARLDGFRTTALHLAPDMRIDVVLAETDVEPLRAQLREYFDKCEGKGGGKRPTAVYSLFLKGTLVALSEFRRRGLALPQRHFAGRLRRRRMDAGDVAGHRRRGTAGAPDRRPRDGRAVLRGLKAGRDQRNSAARACQVLMRESVGSPGAAGRNAGLS